MSLLNPMYRVVRLTSDIDFDKVGDNILTAGDNIPIFYKVEMLSSRLPWYSGMCMLSPRGTCIPSWEPIKSLYFGNKMSAADYDGALVSSCFDKAGDNISTLHKGKELLNKVAGKHDSD